MEYKLIMAVSSFPSLYDSSSLTYRDLNMRSAAWRQVAHIVGFPESECRRKWKMLRDQHRRERQREKERRESGVGLVNYRPWRYSAILSFLNPFIDARAAGTNGWALDPPPPRFGCSTTTGTRSDDDEAYGLADATTTSPSPSLDFAHRKRASSAGPLRLKEAKMEVTSDAAAPDEHAQEAEHVNVKELLEMMMQSVTSLASSLASSLSSDQLSDVQQLQTPSCTTTRQKAEEEEEEPRDAAQRDDVTLFLLSLAPAVRRLPAEKQSWLRAKIQQFVHEAEFGPTDFQ